jgi:hypothetical protein
LLRLIYWLVVILAVCYFAWRFRREIGEVFRRFLRSLSEWWESLFGGKRVEDTAAATTRTEDAGLRARPFASFADPFVTGMAQQRSPAEVIRYSFEAFEAWAREHGYPREPKQTPHEFAVAVGRQQATLAADAATLADLYSRCAYDKYPTPAASVEQLRRLWALLRTATV